jgi:hypothetical protein
MTTTQYKLIGSSFCRGTVKRMSDGELAMIHSTIGDIFTTIQVRQYVNAVLIPVVVPKMPIINTVLNWWCETMEGQMGLSNSRRGINSDPNNLRCQLLTLTTSMNLTLFAPRRYNVRSRQRGMHGGHIRVQVLYIVAQLVLCLDTKKSISSHVSSMADARKVTDIVAAHCRLTVRVESSRVESSRVFSQKSTT